MVRTLAGILAIACAAAVAGWVSTGPAEAASALQVTQLECSIHPGLFDVMYIRNNGDAAQDLSGWQLVSDPEASEQMSLTVAGVLNPGQQLIVVAGLHGVAVPSQNLYLWTNLEVLRDGDPVDYVKLLDGSGALVSGMDCTGQPLGVAPAPAAPQAAWRWVQVRRCCGWLVSDTEIAGRLVARLEERAEGDWAAQGLGAVRRGAKCAH
jgi:hypothetical protein